MKIGDMVRVPDTWCGFTKYGTVVAIFSDHHAVKVRLSYGSRWTDRTYAIGDLEAEEQTWRERQRAKRQERKAAQHAQS